MTRDWVVERIKQHGDTAFLHHMGMSYSYEELLARINEAARFIDEIPTGENVALIGNYSFETIAYFFSLYLKVTTVIPITNVKEEEISKRLTEGQVSYAVTLDKNLDPKIERVATASAKKHPILEGLSAKQRAGLILFSSGSTGVPKAIVHDLDKLLQSYQDKKTRNLCMIVFLMFDHIGGLNTLFNAVAMGGTIVIPGDRSPDNVAELIQRYQVALLPTSPTFLSLMLMSEALERYDLSSLRMVSYGTEPMPESLLQRCKNAFPRKVKFLQTFGTSETGISKTISKSSSSTLMKLDDPDIGHKIVQGQLYLKSKTQTLGYLNAESDSFTDDGWFRTGDIVEEADDGFVRIVGRITEIINVGGQKVLPSEVESVLLEMSQIKDCVVTSIENSITGQAVKADVVLAEGVGEQNIKKTVRSYCRNKLDGYKIPVKVAVVESTSFTERFKKVRDSSSS